MIKGLFAYMFCIDDFLQTERRFKGLKELLASQRLYGGDT